MAEVTGGREGRAAEDGRAQGAQGRPAAPAARARLCVAVLVLMGFALGCSEFVVIGIESELARDFGVSLSTTGQLISLFALPYAVMTPTLALATGRFRRYHVMLAYLALFLLANVVSAFAATFGALLFARIVLGSISGGLLAVGVTFLPELVGAERTSGALTLVYASYSVALIVATSAGKMLASTVGWRVAMYGTLAVCVVACVLLALLMPRSGATDEPASAREQLRLLSEPCILAGMAVFVFGVGSVYTFYGYVTPYLEQVLGMGAADASRTLVAYGAVTLASNFLSGWLDERFGLRSLAVVFPVLAAVLLGLFLAGGNAGPALVMVMLLALLMYLASIPSISNFMDVARRRYPKAFTLASSLEPLSFNVGIAAGTFVGGRVIVGPGISYLGLFGAMLAAVAFVLVLVTIALSRRERARQA